MSFYNSESTLFIDRRRLFFTEEVRKTARTMGIPQRIVNAMALDFDMQSLDCLSAYAFSTKIKPNEYQYTLHIPFIYLLEQSDLKRGSPLFNMISKIYKVQNAMCEDKAIIRASLEIMHNKNFSSIKQFILYHELAHIANGDLIDKENCGFKENQGIPISAPSYDLFCCQKEEKRADLTAASLSGLTEAGIDLMRIGSKHIPNRPTHPTWEQRTRYLTKFAEDKEFYLWKQIEKNARYLGDPPFTTHSPFSRSPSRELSPIPFRAHRKQEKIDIHSIHFPNQSVLDQID